MGLPAGDSLLEIRDRAILKFYLYTGARIETGCKLNVSDFHQDGDEATLRFQLKGARAKTKGIHFSAAEAITEYIKAAGIESGPLFRPFRSRRGDALASRRMTQRSMYRVPIGLSGVAAGCDARERAARWREDPGVCLFAAFDQGNHSNLVAGHQRAD